MGVLNEYFRAPDDEAAASTGERMAGPLDGAEGEPGFDGVSTKSIDSIVVLGQLIALLRGTDWDVDIVGSTSVFPRGPQPDESDFEAMDEDSPWVAGPWVERLSDATRDDLAGIEPARISDLSREWAKIEEFGGFADPDNLRDILADLSALAVRARDADEHLYCWTSL